MPYKSAAQRAWLHVHMPALARRWDKKYRSSATSKRLPYKVNKERAR